MTTMPLLNGLQILLPLDNRLTSTSIQLQNIDPRRGAGPDNLPPALLKFLAPYIFSDSIEVFKILLRHIKHTSRLAFSYIIPSHKKGSKSNPLNYRPISITSVLSEIFELIISHIIHNYLERHNLFFKNQHGFRSKYGCDAQLLETVI